MRLSRIDFYIRKSFFIKLSDCHRWQANKEGILEKYQLRIVEQGLSIIKTLFNYSTSIQVQGIAINFLTGTSIRILPHQTNRLLKSFICFIEYAQIFFLEENI